MCRRHRHGLEPARAVLHAAAAPAPAAGAHCALPGGAGLRWGGPGRRGGLRAQPRAWIGLSLPACPEPLRLLIHPPIVGGPTSMARSRRGGSDAAAPGARVPGGGDEGVRDVRGPGAPSEPHQPGGLAGEACAHGVQARDGPPRRRRRGGGGGGGDPHRAGGGTGRLPQRAGRAHAGVGPGEVQWARPRVTFDVLLSAVLTSLWDSLSGGIFANARPPGQAWDVQDPGGLRRRLRRHRVAGVPGMFCTLFFLSLVLKMVFI